MHACGAVDRAVCGACPVRGASRAVAWGGMVWRHGEARGEEGWRKAHSGCSALKVSLIFFAASTYTARSVAGSAFQFWPSSTDTAALVLDAEERRRGNDFARRSGARASSKG